MAAASPAELLGVRDGVLRFCRRRLGPRVPVAVVAHSVPFEPHGLPATDEQALARLHDRIARVYAEVGGQYHFTVAVEGGLDSVRVAGESRLFVRCWAAVRGRVGQPSSGASFGGGEIAFGGSGSIEVPARITGGWGAGPTPAGVLGTRRRGGLTQALTADVDDRRKATGDATFYAFSSLLSGLPSAR